MFVQCIVYCVQCTPSPLWLKSVPGWPAISVSTWQEYKYEVGSLKMNTALEYSTRVVQEGDRRCKKSTLNDLAYLTPLRIPLMNPVMGSVLAL
jgi:hypothetical protein